MPINPNLAKDKSEFGKTTCPTFAMSSKKGRHTRLYIFEEDEPRLDQLTRSTGLTSTAALSTIVSAGLRALEAREYRMSLPLRLEVADELSSSVSFAEERPRPTPTKAKSP